MFLRVRQKTWVVCVSVQETGRAGRDNKVATCIMYYSYGDAQKMRHMLKQSAEENGTSKEQMQHNTDSLNAMVCSCHSLGSRTPQP